MSIKEIAYSLLVAILLICFLAFFSVGMCLISNRDVADCRYNTAGDAVFKVVTFFK